MRLLRIRHVTPLKGFLIRLTLTDGTEVERDVSVLVEGPVFDDVRNNPERFKGVGVEAGALVWPGGQDLDPDVVIWGGPPPEEASARPATFLKPKVARNAT